MENIKTFSIKRIILLMQKNIYENLKFVLIGLVTIFGLFSVILFFNALEGGEIGMAWMKMDVFYVVGFVIAGIFISGMAFTNLRNKEKTMSYLTLPASTFEKFISELLLTTVGFIIIYTAIFYVYNFIIYSIGVSINIETNIINIFDEKVLDGYAKYIILQSIFLAGAATFRKIPLFYTVFSLFIFGIIIMIFAGILTVSMKEYFVGMGVKNTNFHGAHIDFEGAIKDSFLVKYAEFMFYYITAPVFWLVTYLKLKEKEV